MLKTQQEKKNQSNWKWAKKQIGKRPVSIQEKLSPWFVEHACNSSTLEVEGL